MTSRRKTRELALGAIYEIEVGKHDPNVVIERTIEDQDIEAPASVFFRDAVSLSSIHREKVDLIIGELAVGWRIERIAKVDLAILRLAIVELLVGLEESGPPAPVIINEAVVLAKKFSTAESGTFINGILASVFREREKYIGILLSAD